METVRKEFAKAIHELKKISQESSKLRETYYNASIGAGTSSFSMTAASVASETMIEMAIDDSLSAGRPVGMDARLDELLELIQQQQQLKVISIVGFDGIGKTLLAGMFMTQLRTNTKLGLGSPQQSKESQQMLSRRYSSNLASPQMAEETSASSAQFSDGTLGAGGNYFKLPVPKLYWYYLTTPSLFDNSISIYNSLHLS